MKTLLAVLTIFCVCIPVNAQESATEKKTSPVMGSWKWDRADLAGDIRCDLILSEKDGVITGKYSDTAKIKARVGKVTISDNEVSVVLTIEKDDAPTEVTLKGVLSGDTITGTISSSHETQKWNARRFVSLDEASGKWRMAFTTPDGAERTPEFSLSAEDGRPVVSFDASLPGRDTGPAEVSHVDFQDGHLTFSVKLDFQGQQLNLEYEMDIKGDDLEGSMFFEFADDSSMSGDVDLSGTRIK